MNNKTFTAAALILTVLISSTACMQVKPAKAGTPKTITVPDDYSTIQAAIDSANAGDTVYVKRGHYNQIVVEKPVSVIGEDNQETVITGTYYSYSPNNGVVVIHSDNVTISGFSLIGDGRLDGIRGSGDNPSNIRIIGNNIQNTTDAILFTVYGGENLLVSQNNITGSSDFGVYTTQSNSVISDNTISGSGDAGIIVDECQNVTIKQNRVTGNGDGIFLRWTGPFYVYENIITENSGSGVRFGENCGNSIVNNNFVARNQVGVGLSNYDESLIGIGNTVCFNNLVNNSANAYVGHSFPDNRSDGENGTDSVSWDNGLVGNYWSDFQSKYLNASVIDNSGIWDTMYVIDANNIDRYPLARQVDITATVPTPTPVPPPSPTSNPTQAPSPSIPELPSIIILSITFIAITTAIAAIARKKLTYC